MKKVLFLALILAAAQAVAGAGLLNNAAQTMGARAAQLSTVTE